ncbi:MAG: hypothetical protein AAF366_17435 [Pseudomonadota bacterium]
MLAWDIFKKAVLLIFDNIAAALRISLVPYGLLVAVNLYFLDSLAPMAMLQSGDATALETLPSGFFGSILLTVAVQVFVFIWIAVAWHRYVLLEEGGNAWVPQMNGGHMLGYLGRSILLGLLILAALIAITVAIGFIMPFAAVALSGLVSIILVYRLGLILPAGAVGKPITMGEAWEASKGHSTTVVLLAIITFIASLMLQIPTAVDAVLSGAVDPASDPAQALEATTSPVSLVYNLVINWIVLVVGVSILSTLYGHFVEGRPLD